MAVPVAAPLTPNQIEQLAAALRDWAGRHPQPDEAVLGFVGSQALSPRELAGAVAQQSPDGRDFVRLVQFGLEVTSFETILAGLSGTTGAVR
jgi:hypothetical protein